MKNKLFPTVLFSAIILLFACGENKTEEKPEEEKPRKGFSWLRNIIGNFSSQDTVFLDSNYVDKFLADHPSFKKYQKDIRQFYTERKNAYAWYDGRGIIEQADNLYARIREMENDGIEDSVPYMEKFNSLMDRPNRKDNRQELELMLTSQYFVLANQAWKGLTDAEIRRLGWFIPRKKVSYVSFLDSQLSSDEDEFLEAEPVNPQYEALKNQLSKYRELDTMTAKVNFTVPKKPIKPGDSSALIPLIRERLVRLGDLRENNQSNIHDASLEAAVKSFQDRHGLEVDGIIGKSMIDELNVPISKRIQTIIVNMERARWVPIYYSTKKNYLFVNIPEYKLHVMENNKPVWESNVVVGEDENKTVIFRGMMDHIVFSPHWNVPESIVKEEIMPEMEKDTDYLEKQNLEITGEKDGIPIIRQKPGSENSLGLVKFMFPNTHNIYLHDSPAKELFNRSSRAFSHGCVRVGEPVKLAHYVLRDMPEWTPEKIDEAMHSGNEKYVNLKTPIPVFITYFTAWVDHEGKLNFRKDIYDNDQRLARMILE